MVIGVEIAAYAANLLWGQLLFYEPAVYALRRQPRHGLAELLYEPALLFLALAVQALDVKFVDEILDRDVAGEIPEVARQLPAHKEVAENAVERDMQIIPCRQLPRALEQAADMYGVVVEVTPVCGQLGRYGFVAVRGETDQSGLHEAQVYEQRAAGEFEYLACKLHRLLRPGVVLVVVDSGRVTVGF